MGRLVFNIIILLLSTVTLCFTLHFVLVGQVGAALFVFLFSSGAILATITDMVGNSDGTN